MGLSDLARKAEEKINNYNLRRTKAAGWVPEIRPYRGYGTTRRLHVIGRVLMKDPNFDEELTVNAKGQVSKVRHEAERGWRQFMTIQVGDFPIKVIIGDAEFDAFTNSNGYFDISIDDHGLDAGWQEVQIEAEGAEPVTEEVLITSEDVTVGIVSDIDDTIMVTNLPRAMHAAYNSWVKRTNNRQPVAGMQKFFSELLDDFPDAPVFYLSTGAWNTYDTLVRFIEEQGLPKGPLLLTDWGPTPTGFFRNGVEHKKVQLRNLIIDYPNIQWILVGDNGQHDPLTYGNLAAEHPDAVAGVAIRELTPAEHVLSHGTTASLTGPSRVNRAGVPTISAPDGHGLLKKFLKKPFVDAGGRYRAPEPSSGDSASHG